MADDRTTGYDDNYAPISLLMLTFSNKSATSHSCSYPIVFTRLGGPRSRLNQFFKSMEGHWIFENRILRRIFGPKRNENGEWRRLHNEELHSFFYRSPNIVRVIKSKIEGGRSAFNILTENV